MATVNRVSQQQFLLEEPLTHKELEDLRGNRETISRCVSCCCFIPCLPITICRICHTDLAPETEDQRKIKRCWEIQVGKRPKPENWRDLICQAMSPDPCVDFLAEKTSRGEFPSRLEYLLPAEQRMET